MANNDVQVLLAKQPIFDKQKELFGFELLFRTPLQKNAWEVGEDRATSEVLVNYSTSVMEEAERQNHPLFVNVSESFILSEVFLPVDPKAVIIEILERANVSKELVEAISRWRKKGFRFALDDFAFDEQWDSLIPLAEFIKVDILDAELDSITAHMARINQQHRVKWLAERIEDHETLDKCIAMGFDYFQGYVLARPRDILGNTIRASSTITTEIIKQSSHPDANINTIAELVSRDPKLSIQLLKVINSSLFTLPREINDIKEAITFLGIDTLRQWALMIAFVTDSAAPMESSRIILARAKCCEYLARELAVTANQGPKAFLVGMLSGADLLLQVDPAQFVMQMQLGDEIREAILNNKGSMGEILGTVRKAEYALCQSVGPLKELDENTFRLYAQAQQWADDVIREIS